MIVNSLLNKLIKAADFLEDAIGKRDIEDKKTAINGYLADVKAKIKQLDNLYVANTSEVSFKAVLPKLKALSSEILKIFNKVKTEGATNTDKALSETYGNVVKDISNIMGRSSGIKAVVNYSKNKGYTPPPEPEPAPNNEGAVESIPDTVNDTVNDTVPEVVEDKPKKKRQKSKATPAVVEDTVEPVDDTIPTEPQFDETPAEVVTEEPVVKPKQVRKKKEVDQELPLSNEDTSTEDTPLSNDDRKIQGEYEELDPNREPDDYEQDKKFRGGSRDGRINWRQILSYFEQEYPRMTARRPEKYPPLHVDMPMVENFLEDNPKITRFLTSELVDYFKRLQYPENYEDEIIDLGGDLTSGAEPVTKYINHNNVGEYIKNKFPEANLTRQELNRMMSPFGGELPPMMYSEKNGGYRSEVVDEAVQKFLANNRDTEPADIESIDNQPSLDKTILNINGHNVEVSTNISDGYATIIMDADVFNKLLAGNGGESPLAAPAAPASQETQTSSDNNLVIKVKPEKLDAMMRSLSEKLPDLTLDELEDIKAYLEVKEFHAIDRIYDINRVQFEDPTLKTMLGITNPAFTFAPSWFNVVKQTKQASKYMPLSKIASFDLDELLPLSRY